MGNFNFHLNEILSTWFLECECWLACSHVCTEHFFNVSHQEQYVILPIPHPLPFSITITVVSKHFQLSGNYKNDIDTVDDTVAV